MESIKSETVSIDDMTIGKLPEAKAHRLEVLEGTRDFIDESAAMFVNGYIAMHAYTGKQRDVLFRECMCDIETPAFVRAAYNYVVHFSMPKLHSAAMKAERGIR